MGSVLKRAVGEGSVEPVENTGGWTDVSFCSIWAVDSFVSTTLVETSGNVAVTTVVDFSCFSDAVETWIEVVSDSFDVVKGILVSSDGIEEGSEPGNPVSYTVVGNVDGVSGSVDVVEESKDGSSVSYILARLGVDTFSSLWDVVAESSGGGNPVSCAADETNVVGVSVPSAVLETSMDGTFVL